jgi:nicotinate phosphoribosyltransferase
MVDPIRVPFDERETCDSRDVPSRTSALLVDLYELTMGEGYVAEAIAEQSATFEVFCRHLPAGWGYLLAAGIDDAIDYLEQFRFTDDELSYLETTGLFHSTFLDRLERLRFSGEVRAMREGTLFFANEPLLEVTAPLLEAQLVETIVLNRVHFQSLVASKAARCVDAAQGRKLVDFALRRTHGTEAGLAVARASYLAGFDATSNVLAGRLYGMPVAGTMAHSFVECFEDENNAFEAFTRAYPNGCTLLIDTYDTITGAKRAARVAHALAHRGGRLAAVRLDSGDLLELSCQVRRVLDHAGLEEVTIFASGGLDEREIARLLAAGAPIAGFGVGSKLGVSADAPVLDVAYKLVAFHGRPVLKLSSGKATLPGTKQVWRRVNEGQFAGDVICLLDEEPPPAAEPLLEPMMTQGSRVAPTSLARGRSLAAAQRAALPPEHRLVDAHPYRVELGAGLRELRDRLVDDLARSLCLPVRDVGMRTITSGKGAVFDTLLADRAKDDERG